MKSAGKARNNGLYRHIRTSKEIIRNLLNDYINLCLKNVKVLSKQRAGKDPHKEADFYEYRVGAVEP